MKNKILLPLDGSEASLKAFIPAKSISELLELPLVILNISEEEPDKNILLQKLKIDKENLKNFMMVHKTGNPADIILEESVNCGYIVMGSHGETCDTKIHAGSVTTKVIENTYTPVLLIRPEIELQTHNGKWIPHKPLIPLNGTPNSAQALAPAINIISRLNTEVDLLHVSSPEAGIPEEEGSLCTPYYTDYPQYEWASWAKEFLKRFCLALQENSQIQTNLSVAHGTPGDEILNFARKNNNDLIAIAWHGTFSHLRAATLRKVLFKCPCPIMMIKIK